jgi:transposase
LYANPGSAALGGRGRSAQLQWGGPLSADAASWNGDVAEERRPNAVLRIDPYHVIARGNEALDQVRRGVWNDSRKGGEKHTAKLVEGARYALVKNPENLTEAEGPALHLGDPEPTPVPRLSAQGDAPPGRRYEGRRGHQAPRALARMGSTMPNRPFVKLGRSIRRHREGIEASLRHRMSNGRAEGTNNQIRLLTRIAHGFHSSAALIALVFLKLTGLRINLPARPRLSCPTDIL